MSGLHLPVYIRRRVLEDEVIVSRLEENRKKSSCQFVLLLLPNINR